MFSEVCIMKLHSFTEREREREREASEHGIVIIYHKMIRFSLRDKRLFEIIEVEITRVDCN